MYAIVIVVAIVAVYTTDFNVEDNMPPRYVWAIFLSLLLCGIMGVIQLITRSSKNK